MSSTSVWSDYFSNKTCYDIIETTKKARELALALYDTIDFKFMGNSYTVHESSIDFDIMYDNIEKHEDIKKILNPEKGSYIISTVEYMMAQLRGFREVKILNHGSDSVLTVTFYPKSPTLETTTTEVVTTKEEEKE